MGFYIFEPLLEKAYSEGECRTFLALLSDVQKFSVGAFPTQSQDLLKKRENYCLQRFFPKNMSQERITLSHETNVCGSVMQNPILILRTTGITLTSEPFEALNVKYALGKDNENFLYLFELEKKGVGWELKKQPLARKNQDWINFNGKFCPHSLTLNQNHELTFVTESIYGIINPFSGKVKRIEDLTLFPHDNIVLETFVTRFQKILNSTHGAHEELQLSVLNALGDIYHVIHEASTQKNILQKLTNHFEISSSKRIKNGILNSLTKIGTPAFPILEWIFLTYPDDENDILRTMQTVYREANDFPPFFNRLTKSSDPQIRKKIIRILGHHLREEAISLLFEILEWDKNLDVRIEAVRALRGLKFSESITSALLDFLKSHGLPVALHMETIETLGSKYDIRSVPLLIEYLSNSNEHIRKKAAGALVTSPRIARGSALPGLLIKTIHAALNDEDKSQRKDLETLLHMALVAIGKTITPYSLLEESYLKLLPTLLIQTDLEIAELAVSIIGSNFSENGILSLLSLYPTLPNEELKKYLKNHLLKRYHENSIPQEYVTRVKELSATLAAK